MTISSDSSKDFVIQKKVLRLISLSQPLMYPVEVILKILRYFLSLRFRYLTTSYSYFLIWKCFTIGIIYSLILPGILQFFNIPITTIIFWIALFYSYITLFNSLPNHIKSVQSRTLFSRSLLQNLTFHCFYSVQMYQALALGRAT